VRTHSAVSTGVAGSMVSGAPVENDEISDGVMFLMSFESSVRRCHRAVRTGDRGSRHEPA